MDKVTTIDAGNQGTSKRLATLLGLTQRRIQQLTTEGVFAKCPDNRYNLPAAIQAYVEFIKLDAIPKAEHGSDYWTERTAHEAAKRKLTEIKLAKLENRMHDARDIELVMTEMLTNLRTQLLGMPSTLSGQLADKSQEQIYEIMTQAIESKLLELSDYSPELFEGEPVED